MSTRRIQKSSWNVISQLQKRSLRKELALLSWEFARRTLEREFLVADGEDNSSPKCSNLGEGVLGPSLSLSLSHLHCACKKALWPMQNGCIPFEPSCILFASFVEVPAKSSMHINRKRGISFESFEIRPKPRRFLIWPSFSLNRTGNENVSRCNF